MDQGAEPPQQPQFLPGDGVWAMGAIAGVSFLGVWFVVDSIGEQTSTTWPLVVGAILGVASGILVFLWSVREFSKGKTKPSRRSLTTGAIVGFAGLAAAADGQPLVQATVLVTCLMWFGTVFTSASVWSFTQRRSRRSMQ